MSSDTGNGYQTDDTDPLDEELKAAIDDLYHVIGEFASAQTLGAQQQRIAEERLHTAVLNVWWRMRAELQDGRAWKTVDSVDAVDGETIFTGSHPVTGSAVEIEGLADIEPWTNKTYTKQSRRRGPRSGSASQTVPLRLPPEAALTTAKVLLELYHEQETEDTYKVSNRRTEDYDDPVKDGIPKPQ